MSKSIFFVAALSTLVFAQNARSGWGPCEEKPGYDEILVRCKVLDSGRLDPKSLFELDSADFCVRKREVNFDTGPANSYYVEGTFDGAYLGTKRSKDGLFPGEKNDPRYSPGDRLQSDDREMSVSGYTRPDGGRMSWYGMEAEITQGQLSMTNEAMDGMDRYLQVYRGRVNYDFKARVLEISYDRDFSVVPIIRSWKTLLNARLRCE